MFNELILLITPILLSGITFIFFLKYFNRNQKSAILNFPLDFNQKFRGKRIFGDNKTIKGPLFMGIFTMIYGTIIYLLITKVPERQVTGPTIPFNFLLLGLCYSFGELPNSFLKRQLSISPGEKARGRLTKYIFNLNDTFDSLIAIALAAGLLFGFSIGIILIAVIIGGIIHKVTDLVMMRIKLKQ